jgi:hypothetical protein
MRIKSKASFTSGRNLLAHEKPQFALLLTIHKTALLKTQHETD